MQTIFVTGGTGYIGSRLITALRQRGDYHIKALVRQVSRHKLPKGCEVIAGDALDATTYGYALPPAAIFIHLVGVSHPSPAKKKQFRDIDLASVQQAALAARKQNIQHLIYVSVTQFPTNIMKEYQAARAAGEAALLQTGITCSFLRPWYVLGPGHWWPLLLKPFYWIGKRIPAFKEMSEKLDTVTITDMIAAILYCIDHPPVKSTEIYEVSDIKSIAKL